ncbi:linear amide C-N hydrolase [Legionella cardiaca]|uniref:Linear amide C-N hydrolase n=1 Tax=Legionella cardiaca TaxID=1071983 RepID=A0ABY8ASE4_9GAMM|nr:linear amide C-N hydrolase [Legionella cardiaca]WED42102.1 linear amide C-N hydrolase [Legionella cardiaca]
MNKLIFVLITFFSTQVTVACTRIFWNEKNVVTVARTFDWDNDYNETLLILPRNRLHTGDTTINEAVWHSKFGSIVVQENYMTQRAITDGVNEAGLAAHLLVFEDGQYQSRDIKRPGVSIRQWLQYYLDNFASVNEVINNIDNIQIVPAGFAKFDNLSLHVAIEDSSGDSAIIEFIAGNLSIHHNSAYRVMTNEPTYEQQLENLWRYEQKNCMRKELPLDDKSQSRFVRASCYLRSLPTISDSRHAVALLASIAENVSVAYGMSQTEATWWRTYIDFKNHNYYFKSTQVPGIFWLNFAKINFGNPASYREIHAHDSRLMGDIT